MGFVVSGKLDTILVTHYELNRDEPPPELYYYYHHQRKTEMI